MRDCAVSGKAREPVSARVQSDHDTGMIKGLELQIDFFLPVWRRVVLLAVCFGWAAVEFLSGAPFWGSIFAALGGYALWQLFLCDWPDDSAEH